MAWHDLSKFRPCSLFDCIRSGPGGTHSGPGGAHSGLVGQYARSSFGKAAVRTLPDAFWDLFSTFLALFTALFGTAVSHNLVHFFLSIMQRTGYARRIPLASGKQYSNIMKTTMTINGGKGLMLLVVACSGVLSSCSHKSAPVVSGQAAKKDSITAAATALHALPVDTVAIDLLKRNSSVESFWRAEVVSKTASFYRLSGYHTKWFYDKGPSPLLNAALDILRDAAAHGLDQSSYIDDEFENRIRAAYKDTVNASVLVGLDMAFTDRFMLFTTHVSSGRVTSVANGKSVWKRGAFNPTMLDVQAVALATTQEDLSNAIREIQPQNEQYIRLQKALAYYRGIENHVGQPISVSSPVKPGERNIAVPRVRERMYYLNGNAAADKFLAGGSAGSDSLKTQHPGAVVDSLFYDADLVAAVQLYQRRHGLTPDGVIGERTLRFMNQKMSDRIAQISINMERLRWMPQINSERYLLVNIPDYKLTVYEGAQRAMDMRVIVGSANTPTPVFNDQLNHIVFSPTWTVPVSIVRNEIIPNLRKDSTYYSEKNFVIYKQDVQIDPVLENWKDPNINPYQLRVVQNPGADNSLGSVKFMMPNNMSVYLHDTPSRRLFTKDYRALSHGCVRLGEPAKLAEYLLKDQQGWDATKISKAMSGASPATILLKKKYPVYLTYQTAWVDDEGLLQFREDIYGHDKQQAKQLVSPRPATATTIAISAAGM